MKRVEVFADVVCPFAYVGLRELMRRRDAAGRSDVHLIVRSWPLELVNGRPVDGHFIGEEIDEIRPQIAPDAFVGFDPASFPASSIPALSLAASAYASSDQVGEAVSMALRVLLFEHGRDIADPTVLHEVAARHGLASPALEAEPVVADWEDGKRRGVVGSPHFFIDGASWFCPVLDISRDAAGHLHVTVDEVATGEFLGHVFG